MRVLGLNIGIHDTGAAIISDQGGRVEAVAISEARLDRIKHSKKFPLMSIEYCLGHFGLGGLDDIDIVCVDRQYHLETQGGYVYDRLDFPSRKAPPFVGTNLRGNTGNRNSDLINAMMLKAALRGKEVHWVDHVDAHAASGYFASGFEDAAVLSVEGGIGIYHGVGPELRRIDRIGYGRNVFHNGERLDYTSLAPTNIAYLYDILCDRLGYDYFAAGKVMALSSFAPASGSPDHIDFAKTLVFDFFADYGHSTFPEDVKRKVAAATAGKSFCDESIAVAGQVQREFNAEMLRLARLAGRKTGAANLCLTGGSALSCVSNRLTRREAGFDSLFIQPAASDEGIPLGCALWGYHMIGGATRRWEMSHAYLGHPNDPARLPGLLDGLGLAWRKAEPREVAGLLAAGKVVGRCFGASEYGPRALGNRSILADPRPATIKDHINRNVKHRESYRPFAPSVLDGRAGEYFEDGDYSPFMVVATSVRPEFLPRLPGIAHVDGTSRVQTVSREVNPAYFDLIEAFGDITGVYCLLNTSFNDNDEPIVETYEDAIISFHGTNIDCLYMDGLLVSRPETGLDDIAARLRAAAADLRHARWRAGFAAAGLVTAS